LFAKFQQKASKSVQSKCCSRHPESPTLVNANASQRQSKQYHLYLAGTIMTLKQTCLPRRMERRYTFIPFNEGSFFTKAKLSFCL